MIMTRLMVEPKNKRELLMVEKVLEALKVKYVPTEEEDAPYNPEFIAKILKGREDSKNGKGRNVTMNELNALWK